MDMDNSLLVAGCGVFISAFTMVGNLYQIKKKADLEHIEILNKEVEILQKLVNRCEEEREELRDRVTRLENRANLKQD